MILRRNLPEGSRARFIYASVRKIEDMVLGVVSTQCRSFCDNKDRTMQTWEEKKMIKAQEE
jgi:hypothetical protein